jgi:hypothetical protein
MSDKSEPRKKPAKAEESVLGSLPSTRPARIGRRPAATPKATAAEPKTKPAPKPKAAAKPKAGPKPRPEPAPEPPRRTGPPSGTELVTTAAQAVVELGEIGVTLAGQVVRRAARRIPRP